MPGAAGAAGVTVSPAFPTGGELEPDPRGRPLSGTHRLGVVSTPDGALLLTGTFQAGRMMHVSASRGRTRVTAAPVATDLGRGLDAWRFTRPAPLPTPGGRRQCGVESARIDVPPGAAAGAGLEAGSYVSVAWVCELQTEARWLFHVPRAEPAAAPPPAAPPDTLAPSS